jgi:hypothetical protein
MKVKTVKPDTKMNANLQNIENFENELIRANYVEHSRYMKIQYGILTHNV